MKKGLKFLASSMTARSPPPPGIRPPAFLCSSPGLGASAFGDSMNPACPGLGDGAPSALGDNINDISPACRGLGYGAPSSFGNIMNGIPSSPGLGYGATSTFGDLGYGATSTFGDRMNDTSESPRLGYGAPPGLGDGLDCLAAQDLCAIFSHGSPGSPTNPAIREDFDPKVFPAVSIFHERACLDQTCTAEKKFMKLYDVKERFSKGKGTVNINITEEPKDGSPSTPIFKNPSQGVEVVLDSVFRTRLSMGDTSTVFTSWVACPPSGPQRTAVCYTSGHSYAGDHYGLSYSFEGADFQWNGGSGCFGSHVKSKDLWRGFTIGTNPLAVVYNSKEDLACFQAFNLDTEFLLPCSVDEINIGGFVTTFGYPCIDYFLYEARDELIFKNEDHGIGKLYDGLAADPAELYKLLQETFGSFNDGQLLCSPGVLTSHDANNLYIKSSTLKGSSGSPVIPAGLPGYTIGVHKGGTCADTNVAVCTDSPAFVHSYASHVLPRLPSPDDVVFRFRDLGPFYRWLNKHGLIWCNVEQEFLTPPPKLSRRLTWAIAN